MRGVKESAVIVQTYNIMQAYEPYRAYILDQPGKTYLGKKNARRCRYCGKSAPAVTFRKKAHAIPHLTANKSLFSYDECDECNKYFSESVEDNFAKLFNPLRTMFGIPGYNGVPSYKTKDGSGRIDATGKTHLAIKDHGTTPFVTDDPENKSFSVKLVCQPHVPILVYKCLVKSALAIMPDNELHHFTRTIEWLMLPDPASSVSHVPDALCYLYFFPGRVPNVATLLRRRMEGYPLPYMLFSLTLDRLMFCICLPLSAQDEDFGGQIQFSGMGPITHAGKEVPCTVLQLASAKIVKDRVIDVSVKYESLQVTDKK